MPDGTPKYDPTAQLNKYGIDSSSISRPNLTVQEGESVQITDENEENQVKLHSETVKELSKWIGVKNQIAPSVSELSISRPSQVVSSQHVERSLTEDEFDFRENLGNVMKIFLYADSREMQAWEPVLDELVSETEQPISVAAYNNLVISHDSKLKIDSSVQVLIANEMSIRDRGQIISEADIKIDVFELVGSNVGPCSIVSKGADGESGIDGLQGEDGRAGKDGKNARCRWYGDKPAKNGKNGEVGGPGGTGGQGDDGEDATNVIVDTEIYNGNICVDARGGRGGQGGRGGKGGTGGKGGKGGSGKNCETWGSGGNGGVGGRGGDGGKGGNGGNGGNVAFLYTIANSTAWSAFANGGSLGQPGELGEGGEPGEPGSHGDDKGGTFWNRRTGKDGEPGERGPRGDRGERGESNGLNGAVTFHQKTD
jgi:hypothetical protein